MVIRHLFRYFCAMKINLTILTLIICLGLSQFSLAQTSCKLTTDGLASMQIAQVTIVNDGGEEVVIKTLVADSNFERASGFQHICPSVIENTWILFRYPVEISSRFHMHNVHAPLDIAFFSNGGRLLETFLMQTYSDGNTPIYGPNEPFQYALEAPQGFFAGRDISAENSRLIRIQ